MVFIGQILLLALKLVYWVIIIQVVLSWLIAFDVINIKNEKARGIVEGLHKLTDPIYKPLRKIIPSIGGIDVSPIAVILGIYILQMVVINVFFG